MNLKFATQPTFSPPPPEFQHHLRLSACAKSLRRFTKQPGVVLPALEKRLRDTNAVVRAYAAGSIEPFGAAAKDTIPILLKLHKDDPAREVRRVATQAAIAIEQKANAKK